MPRRSTKIAARATALQAGVPEPIKQPCAVVKGAGTGPRERRNLRPGMMPQVQVAARSGADAVTFTVWGTGTRRRGGIASAYPWSIKT